MVDRRTFTTLLLGGIAAPKVSLARDSNAKNVFYASIGPELTLYSVDVDGTALVKRDTISTRANNAWTDNQKNPGSIKTFSFKDGGAHKSRGDPASRRHELRAAASRLPPDAAVGLCFDREPE